jgi:hypothetical protein
MTGPKSTGDHGRAPALDCKQADQDHDGHRDNDVLERGSRNLQTFDCGEHGNRRRDHRVAKEHRSADHAEGQKQPTAAA